jgi:hypothetical protein
MAWHTAKDEKAGIKAASESHGKAIKKFLVIKPMAGPPTHWWLST